MQIVEDGPALVTKSSLQMESSSPRAARPGSREKRSREGPGGGALVAVPLRTRPEETQAFWIPPASNPEVPEPPFACLLSIP